MAEKRIFAITGFNQNNGLSVGVQADTREEFESIVSELRQYAARDAVIAQLFAPVVGVVQSQPASGNDEAQALAALQQAFPNSTVVPQSTVGQPLPQPTVPAAVPATPAAVGGPNSAPPGVAYPGDCPHGPRVFKDVPARGKAWLRWECATPWQKGMTKEQSDARCKPVNVEN